MNDADIVIVGGGLVGAALAAALSESALRIIVMDGQPAPEPQAGWDARIYAISAASQRLLRRTGAWQRMDASRLQGVSRMQIFGDERAHSLTFDALDAGVDQLATIVESGRLQHALWQVMQEAGNVELMCPACPQSLEVLADCARVTLEDGRVVTSAVVIGADGANSWVRRMAGIPVSAHPYEQWGVVANFECSRPHLGGARQWFFDDGVLAFLPLAGDRMSMVWSCQQSLRDELVAATVDDLARRVAEAGAHALGELRAMSPAQAFPLVMRQPERIVSHRLALIGDAAHTVHPLAGQGVNLGFGDVEELAATLAALPAERCGDLSVLRRYERARSEPVKVMQHSCDALQRLFNQSNPVLRLARNVGLGLTDQQAWLKRRLIRYAMSA
ncbi:UbiH/UbiF family hydroxylase [Chitinibacteraceae bacterium HSL-7]